MTIGTTTARSAVSWSNCMNRCTTSSWKSIGGCAGHSLPRGTIRSRSENEPMSETERLRTAIQAAREIKQAIDEIREEYGIDADYPGYITVDRQTFMWSQLCGETR